jgi:hypothetical protein
VKSKGPGGRRPRRLALALLFSALLGAVLVLLLPASPASADCRTNPLDCLPFSNTAVVDDCKDAPPAARPDSGLAGWFLTEPKNPPKGDPFAPDAKVSMYDIYGYAGLDFTTYDLGCGPDAVRNPDAVSMNMIANLIYTPAMWLVALDNSVREYAYQPNTMWGWTNDLVQRASNALHERIFTVWGAVALLLVGLWLMWGARGGNMSHAVVTAGWAVLVMVLVTAVAAWPVKASTVADNTLTGALGQVTSVLSKQDAGDGRPPAVRASGVLTETVLYKQYLRGTLGSAESDTAKKYGPDLYRARSISWDEARQIKNDPKKRDALFKAKAELWTTTADKIRTEDPDAYEYLVGRKGAERVGAALLALISAIVVTPFDLMASLLILVAFLIIRLAVAFLPAIGTVGILRPASGPLRGLLRTVLAAIINCVIFGAGSAVFLLAVEVITGTSSLAGWQQILLIWLTGLILWLLLRPYRRLTQLTGVDPFGELAGGLGRMHKRVFGDMKQLAIGAGGTYLGDVAALEARDRKAAEDARVARPETWSRQSVLTRTRAASADAPPGRAAGAPAPAAAAAGGGAAAVGAGRQGEQRRPETAGGRRGADGVVVLPARVSDAADHEQQVVLPVASSRASSMEAGLAEESDSYVIYRPDRGYSAASKGDGDRGARLHQAATNVTQAANAVRDVAVAAGALAKANQDRRSD